MTWIRLMHDVQWFRKKTCQSDPDSTWLHRFMASLLGVSGMFSAPSLRWCAFRIDRTSGHSARLGQRWRQLMCCFALLTWQVRWRKHSQWCHLDSQKRLTHGQLVNYWLAKSSFASFCWWTVLTFASFCLSFHSFCFKCLRLQRSPPDQLQWLLRAVQAVTEAQRKETINMWCLGRFSDSWTPGIPRFPSSISWCPSRFQTEQDSVRAAMQKHIAPLFSGAGRTATQHWDVVEVVTEVTLMVWYISQASILSRALAVTASVFRMSRSEGLDYPAAWVQGIYGLPKQEESRTWGGLLSDRIHQDSLNMFGVSPNTSPGFSRILLSLVFMSFWFFL